MEYREGSKFLVVRGSEPISEDLLGKIYICKRFYVQDFYVESEDLFSFYKDEVIFLPITKLESLVYGVVDAT